MDLKRVLHEKHQFRLVLCGHKAVEAGAVCMLLMVQGNLAAVTMMHVQIASETGLLSVVPVLLVSFTRHAHHFANRWTTSALLGICTFFADAAVHASSQYGGEYAEAALTGLGAFAFSLAISYTPLGKRIDLLAEKFMHEHPVAEAAD